MPTSPPVVQHTSFRHLRRALASRPAWRFIDSLTMTEAGFALAAPVALAHVIATQAQDLLARQSLRILVAGAELIDTIDDGNWYATMPELLGRPDMTVDVSLVGISCGKDPDDEQGEREFRRFYTGIKPNPSRLYTMSLKDFLARQEPLPDIVIFFHPGFVMTHPNWFADDSIHRLIRHGVPLFGTSMHDDDYLMDRLGLESYGFTSVGPPMKNPFALDTDFGHFAHSLWRFPETAPPSVGIFDHKAFERMTALDAILVGAYGDGKLDEIHRLGVLSDYVADDRPDTYIALPFGHWASTSNGQIWLETYDGLSPWVGHILDADDLHAYPGPGADTYSRAVWVTDIASKYNIVRETLETANPSLQEPSDLPGGAEGYTDLERIFSDRDHLEQSLTMILSNTSEPSVCRDPEATEAARELANMFAPEPKRKVSPAARPLFAELEKGNFTAAAVMLRANPDLVRQENEEGETPLYVGVANDRPDFITLCHQLGGDPNHCDREGWPAVLEAVRCRAPGSLAALIRLEGFNIDATNKLGWTALMAALPRGYLELAEMLIDGGADLDARDPSGFSAREMIMDSPNAPESLRARCLARA